RSHRINCGMGPSLGPPSYLRIAIRPMPSRNARYRQPRWQQSTMLLALIEIGCRAACRLSEASVLTRDATRNLKAKTSLGHCQPKDGYHFRCGSMLSKKGLEEPSEQ